MKNTTKNTETTNGTDKISDKKPRKSSVPEIKTKWLDVSKFVRDDSADILICKALDSAEQLNIFAGDFLIIDHDKPPKCGCLVVFTSPTKNYIYRHEKSRQAFEETVIYTFDVFINNKRLKRMPLKNEVKANGRVLAYGVVAYVLQKGGENEK
jgi:hypothetical protein